MYRAYAPRAALAGLLLCLILSACSDDTVGPGGGSGGTSGGGSGGQPATLAFATQPVEDWATKPMSAVTITAQNSTGGRQTAFSGTVTLTLSSVTLNAVLTGTLTARAVNGVATFTGVAVDRPGTGYQLIASADGMTAASSQPFNVGQIPHLVFTAVPSTYRTDQPISPAVLVALQDSAGATVEDFGGTVTLSASAGTGVTLLGNLQATAAHGIATFDNITLPAEGTGVILKAESQFTVAGSSASLTSAPALRFEPLPPEILNGTAVTPGIQVALHSASGAVVTAFEGPVSLALASGTANGTLSGTTTVSAVAGIATFSDLIISQLGSYTIRATTAAYAGATSPVLTVTCAVACWRARAPMHDPRWDAAVGVVNGKLYMAGGIDAGYDLDGSLEAYDPATNGWTQLAPMGTPRYGAGAAVVNGLLYVVGGVGDGANSGSRTLEVYDPATNSWAARAPMPDDRTNFGIGVVSGKIYVLGGSYRTSTDAHILSSTLVYDPATDGWSAGPPMTSPRANMGSASMGGVIAVVGGVVDLQGSPTTLLEFLDPVSGSWTSGRFGAWERSAGNRVAAVATNDRIYAAGSDLGDDYGPQIWRYDVAPQTWQAAANAPIGSPTSMMIVGDTLYLVVGNSLWSYAPLP